MHEVTNLILNEKWKTLGHVAQLANEWNNFAQVRIIQDRGSPLAVTVEAAMKCLIPCASVRICLSTKLRAHPLIVVGPTYSIQVSLLVQIEQFQFGRSHSWWLFFLFRRWWTSFLLPVYMYVWGTKRRHTKQNTLLSKHSPLYYISLLSSLELNKL